MILIRSFKANQKYIRQFRVKIDYSLMTIFQALISFFSIFVRFFCFLQNFPILNLLLHILK